MQRFWKENIVLKFFIYLKGRDRDRSSICWFIAQMPAAVKAEPDQCQTPGLRVAGTQALVLLPVVFQGVHQQGTSETHTMHSDWEDSIPSSVSTFVLTPALGKHSYAMPLLRRKRTDVS